MDITYKVGLVYLVYIVYFITNIGYDKFFKKEIPTVSTKVDISNKTTNIFLQNSIDTSFKIIDFVKESFLCIIVLIALYYLLQYLQTNDKFKDISLTRTILYGLLSLGIIIFQMNITYPYDSETIKFLLYIPAFILISYILSKYTKKDKHNSRIIFGYILLFFYISIYVLTNVINLEKNNFIIQVFLVIYCMITFSIIMERFTIKESYSSLKYIIGSIIVFFFMVTQFIMKRVFSCENSKKNNKKDNTPRYMYTLFFTMFGLSMLVQSTIFCALRAKPETLQHNRILYWIIEYREKALYILFILIGIFSSGLAAIQCKGGLLKNPKWVNTYLQFLRYSTWFHLLLGHFKSSSIFLLLLYSTLPSCVKKECGKDKDGNEEKTKDCDTKENKYVYKKTNILLLIHVVIGFVYLMKYIIYKVKK